MRRGDREVTDIQKILQIINTAKILHLGLFDGEYPYIVPLHYGYEYSEDGHKLTFFMHGSKEGHKLDLIRQNPNVCIELECDIKPLSGGDDPCKYSSEYASFIGKGHIEIVYDEQEKIKGLKLLMKNQTGKEFDIDANMASSVVILKACITKYTAKAHTKV